MKRLMTLLILGLPIIAHSQTNDYRLDSYINPDYKRKELDFNFGSSGAISSDKTKYKSDTKYPTKETERQSFGGGIETQYYQIINSLKKQSKTNAMIDLSGSYLNNNYQNDDDDTKNKNFEINLAFDQQGFYYGKNKKFIEFSPNASFAYSSSSYTYSSSSDNYGDPITSDIERTNKNTLANLSFRLGIGKGRIEQVGDARLAMYILSDLKQLGHLKKTLNPDEVNRLAQQITSIKNKRQFDSRIKLIEEITTVDSFLVANGYTENEKTASFYTSLYDNWLYAGLFERASGSRFSFGIAPHFSWTHYDTDYTPSRQDLYDRNDYYSDINGSIYASYQYEKPANLYLQHSIYTELTGEWGKRRGEDNNYFAPTLSGSYGLGYYPNSRTHIRTSYSLLLHSNQQKDWDTYSISNQLGADMYYYLSPQLRLSASGGLSYWFYHSERNDLKSTQHNKYPNLSFNIGLQYSIF